METKEKLTAELRTLLCQWEALGIRQHAIEIEYSTLRNLIVDICRKLDNIDEAML